MPTERRAHIPLYGNEFYQSGPSVGVWIDHSGGQRRVEEWGRAASSDGARGVPWQSRLRSRSGFPSQKEAMSVARHGTPRPGELRREPCPGCGAWVPAVDAPSHPTLGAAPGCWTLFEEVLHRQFAGIRDPASYRLAVDTYAVQHPGAPSRDTIQSIAGHLISLHLVLERGLDPTTATRELKRAVTRSSMFSWLRPPHDRGGLTVADVRSASELADHEDRVRRWARSAWEAWSDHHDTVRSWAVLP